MNESVYVQHPDIQGYYAAKADLEGASEGFSYALYTREGTAIRHVGSWNRGTAGVGWQEWPQEESDES